MLWYITGIQFILNHLYWNRWVRQSLRKYPKTKNIPDADKLNTEFIKYRPHRVKIWCLDIINNYFENEKSVLPVEVNNDTIYSTF